MMPTRPSNIGSIGSRYASVLPWQELRVNRQELPVNRQELPIGQRELSVERQELLVRHRNYSNSWALTNQIQELRFNRQELRVTDPVIERASTSNPLSAAGQNWAFHAHIRSTIHHGHRHRSTTYTMASRTHYGHIYSAKQTCKAVRGNKRQKGGIERHWEAARGNKEVLGDSKSQ